MPSNVFVLRLNIFVDLLRSVLFRLDQSVEDVISVSERELGQIWEWNGRLPDSIDRCMHEIISENAIKHPTRPAVLSHDGELTYGELDRLSTHMAVKLSNIGVGIGDIIPLCFEKSKWTAVGLLAVMKAGAGFSLTDPSQPEARLQIIASETKAKAIVTSLGQADLACRIAPSAEVITVGPRSFKEELSSNALPKVPSDQMMYIIYTSGSTGKPKGVMISHRSFTSGAIPRAKAVGYEENSRVFDFTSYAFDVSIDNMLCTLAVGGCICVPSEADRVNNMSGSIRDMRVNMVHTTPSIARVLDADVIPSLEVLGLGGEAVSAGDALAWSQTTKVIVAYGPSECTVGCTINNEVTRGERPYTSIGKGIGGVTWIVDPEDHNKLTPIGGVGELLIEGPVVGQGYLNEPEKTSEVFIESPKWLLAGDGKIEGGRHGKLYKTGDLVKYDPDGSGEIVFVGRKDQQVKIRGQRVELAEVEHHLRKRLPPSMRIAAEVITPDGNPNDKTLVAFLEESEGGEKLDENNGEFGSPSLELRKALEGLDSELGAEIPVYMIPSAYVPLRHMPVMVSGKIDRKQLRSIGSSLSKRELARLRSSILDKRRKPNTDIERKLHQIWINHLGVDTDVGLDDNFFTLGGDSLTAMRVVAAARNDSMILTIADILRNPKLCDMALAVKQDDHQDRLEVPSFSLMGQTWSAESAIPTVARLCNVEPSAVEDVYPCTPLQEGLMALSAKVYQAYIAQRVVTLKDLGSAERLHAAFDTAALDCPILRTRIVQVPGCGLMQVVAKEKITFFNGSNLKEYLLEDQNRPMELGTSLIRFAIIESRDQVHVVLTMHHALYDGWCMPLIVERVNRALQGLGTNRRAAFNAFIKYLVDLDRPASESYWHRQLESANSRQFPILPYPGYQTQADSLVERYISLPKEVQTRTTVATAIRGAWALVASQYTGSDVIFGETLTGRNASIPGVEEIEGPMITTVPTRIRLDQDMALKDLLQHVHDQTVDRIPHEHLGLQNIRRLSPDAREACELRTGFVLHPRTEQGSEPEDENNVTNLFTPADDVEAAREALKFNSYALMLVCTIDPNGFLVMASFDSKTVSTTQIERCLERLDVLIQLVMKHSTMTIRSIERLSDQDLQQIWSFSSEGPSSISRSGDETGPILKRAKTTWVVDPENVEFLLPIGGIGELIVESDGESCLTKVEDPSWLLSGCINHPGRGGTLIRTGILAKYDMNGYLSIIGRVDETPVVKKIARRPEGIKDRLKTFSPKQNRLAHLWSRVIGIEADDIAVDDNFFELGGDSIMAMKLVSEGRAEGLHLNVAQIFNSRQLQKMAEVCRAEETNQVEEAELGPFSSLDIGDIDNFVSSSIQPSLADHSWEILDVLPVRPLQEIAINGTIKLPRYSARYELFHFDGVVDIARLERSCQDLVNHNEILRTIFVENDHKYYGAVLAQMKVSLSVLETEKDPESVAHEACNLDVQGEMPLGSPFVKFIFVRGGLGKSCLILRISHAQYDEICLPILLRQLSALYEERQIEEAVPFSSFVNHVIRRTIPESKDYWRNLLKGSSMTVLNPEEPLISAEHVYMSKAVDISSRSKEVTVATLPTAAWALCLARRLAVRDVTFGEVVTGRSIDMPSAERVVGPCWQYVPFRLQFEPGWTITDLLRAVQQQHVASTQFEGMGLREIVENCTDWPSSTDWFDSVVHQDVEHVESLGFSTVKSHMETIYPHFEPLREWKIQAFHDGDSLRIEVVARESWKEFGASLLDDLCQIMLELVTKPDGQALHD